MTCRPWASRHIVLALEVCLSEEECTRLQRAATTLILATEATCLEEAAEIARVSKERYAQSVENFSAADCSIAAECARQARLAVSTIESRLREQAALGQHEESSSLGAKAQA